jgi:hypothetical protein
MKDSQREPHRRRSSPTELCSMINNHGLDEEGRIFTLRTISYCFSERLTAASVKYPKPSSKVEKIGSSGGWSPPPIAAARTFESIALTSRGKDDRAS